jgi:hypothetical protein
MTDTLGQPDFGARFATALQRVFGFVARAGFGLFLLVAALAALVATTFIGLMLAIAAVFLTIARPRRRAPVSTGRGDDQTLEARRTADGWVIEL